MVVEKLPPHDVEAEEAVVASLLVDPEAIFKVAPVLKPEDFFREQNRWVYEACRELWQRNEAINQISVAHELARKGRLDEIGGAAYLSQLVGELPTPLVAEHYARLVQRDSIYRNLISAAQQIAQIAYRADDPDVSRVLAQAEALISTVRQSQEIRDFLHIKDLLEGYQQLTASLTGQVAAEARSVTTGFMDLETLLGGLRRSELIVVAARTGLGKTSLALNFARNGALRQQAVVAYFSPEMAAEQLVQRMLAMESGVDSAKIGSGIYGDREERLLQQAIGRLGETAIYIDDSPVLNVAEMRAKARRLQMERGALDLVLVDYLQLVQPGIRMENRVQEVSYVSRSLKALARDLDVPVVACAQLSRAADTRATHIPQLSDLRESGSIEQDADVVMFIYREAAYLRRDEWEKMHPDKPPSAYPAEDTQIIIAKHRNGPVGTYHLRFRQKIARFEDLLVREPEAWEEEEEES